MTSLNVFIFISFSIGEGITKALGPTGAVMGLENKVLPKCQDWAVSKNFNGQNLSHWLKKTKQKDHGYHESADST